MKQIITFLGIFLFSFFKMNAQETSSVEQKIESIFAPLSELMNTIVFYSVKVGSVKLPFIIIAIVIAAIFFTIFLNFANVRLMPVALKILKGEAEAKDQIDEPEETGQVTPFQALATALSASVGIGNIGGVAIAIALGGAGATFWMIIAGLLAMSVKMIEATLGVKYREVGEDGQVYGGPMYYLKNGLAEMKLPKLGKVLAYAYALFLVFGSFGASMFQSNQAVVQAQKLMGLESPLGLAVALLALVGFVIVGGVKRIGKVAEKIVPMMGILYVGSALIILGLNYELIPSTISLMLSEAFNVNSFAGGVIGVLIVGFQRAFFSNEAGLGTSSIAHAAVKTRYAASEGIVGAIEPFVDTVIVCTMTAMVIVLMNLKLNLFDYGSVTDSAVIHNQTGESVGGVELTSLVFESAIPNFSIVLTIAVIFFAFSTMLSWSYYGLQGWKYYFGKTKASDLVFKFIFLSFIIVGCSIKLGAVISFVDAVMFAVVAPNIIGLVVLAPKVKREINHYLEIIGFRKK